MIAVAALVSCWLQSTSPGLLAPLEPTFQQLQAPAPAWRGGDVQGWALSSDGTRGYLGEGASIVELDLSQLGTTLPLVPPVLRRFPVDATIMNLLVHRSTANQNELLFVAGGSQGLLVIDLGAPQCSLTPGAPFAAGWSCSDVVKRDDMLRPGPAGNADNEKWCVDVAMATRAGQDVVVALFAATQTAQIASELRIYRRSTMLSSGMGYIGSIPLNSGPLGARGYALATAGSTVYVALGTGGIREVNLDTGVVSPVGFDTASADHDLDAPVIPDQLANLPGRVLDIAYAGGRLFAAVDGFGVVVLDPSSVLYDVLASDSPTVAGNPTTTHFALRLDVQPLGQNGPILVACYGSAVCGAQNGEAIPWSNYGRFGFKFGPGGDGDYENMSATGKPRLFFYRFDPATSSLSPWFWKEQTKTRAMEVSLRPSGLDVRVFEQPRHTPEALQGLRSWVLPASTPTQVAAGKDFPASEWDAGGSQPFAPLLPDLTYSGVGNTPFSAIPLIQDPGRSLVTSEGASGVVGVASQLLDTATEVNAPQLVLPSPLQSFFTSITGEGAHWVESNVEWIVGRYNTSQPAPPTWGWTLNRVTYPAGAPVLEQWRIPWLHSTACLGTPNSKYFHSTLYTDATLNGEFLFCTGFGVEHAGVIYRKRTLVARALVTPPFSTHISGTLGIGCPGDYVALVKTHTGGTEDSEMITGESRVVQFTPGSSPTPHSYALIAAGNDRNGSPPTERPAFAIVDLSQPPTPTPTIASCGICNVNSVPVLTSTIHYSPMTDPGNNISIEVAEFQFPCHRVYAFLGDLHGLVHQWDVTDPTAPFWVGDWELPRCTLDNYYDNVVDLFFDGRDTEHPFLYLTAHRAGLVRLELQMNAGGTDYVLPPSGGWQAGGGYVRKVDTPGLAQEMCDHLGAHDRLGLIVADHSCGIRLFGEW